MKVLIDEAAYYDLEQIRAWVAKDRPHAAARVIDRIFESIEPACRSRAYFADSGRFL